MAELTDKDIEWFNPRAGMPKVRIAYYGIGLNSSAIKMLDNPKALKIGCSNEFLIIKGDKNGLPLNANDEYYRVNSKDLIRFICLHLNLNTKVSIKRELKWNDDQQALIGNFS